MTAEPIDAPPVPCRRRPSSRWTKCPCPQCRADQYRMDKARRTYGTIPRIPPEQAWAAFTALIDAGWSAHAIASACGLSPSYVGDITNDYRQGRTVRIGHTACVALLNPGTPTAGHVPTLPTMRRLRALAAIGWTNRAIADRAGIPLSVVTDARAGIRPTMYAVNANAVTGVYDRLRDVVGPSSRAVFEARRLGWAPPYAWDGHDLTDPRVVLDAYRDADLSREEAARKAARRERDMRRKRLERNGSGSSVRSVSDG